MNQNQYNQKKVATILKVVDGIFVVFVVGLLGLFFTIRLMVVVEKRRVPEMTQERAQTMFRQAGGTDEISGEARSLLDRMGASDFKVFL